MRHRAQQLPAPTLRRVRDRPVRPPRLRRLSIRHQEDHSDAGEIPMITAIAPVKEQKNYLNAEHGLKSWLLTQDHKRIAILYLVAVTAFFVVGGIFAALIRLELATPAGDLLDSNTYNKVFTMHGVVMVFFFLIPSIPAIFGNFLVPLMIGAKDLAFPRINLLSWYIYMLG